MARNVEVKAKVEDVDALRDCLEGLSDAPVEALDQEDVFFDVPRVRVDVR
jgi:adenylate cyclase class IV